MKQFAEIAVNVAGVGETFDYRVPAILQGKLNPGHLVEVPFGSQKVQGILIRLKEESGVEETKDIHALIDREPVISCMYIELAGKLAETYFQPASAYMAAMLPPGLSQKADTLYTADIPDDADLSSLSKLQLRIVDKLVNRGPLRGRQLDRVFRRIDWRKGMRLLNAKGWVLPQPILPPPKLSGKQINTVSLHPDVQKDSIDDLKTGKQGSPASQRRRKILVLLAREGKAVDVSYIYASTSATSADIRYLEEKGLVVVNVREVMRDPVSRMHAEGTARPELTKDQKDAWKYIEKALKSTAPRPVLLHGITGSGKTELYLRAAEEVQKMDRQAVVLVPEIALTPQTIQRFLDRFPGKVGVIHSSLSSGERYDTWRRARSGEFAVLIGPRSALFTPMTNPGVIILDECHDDSYYQGEMAPAYHSVEAAIQLGKINNAAVIFGSATPNVDLYFRAENERWPIVHMNRRIATKKIGEDENTGTEFLPMPKVEIVDMRAELQEGNASIFSRVLQDSLKSVVSRRQQAILFLNRRGSATVIFCRDCGYTANCPRCDFPLTYHRDTKQMHCHICGYKRGELKKCPQCGSMHIQRYGMGTERVEAELQLLIPSARVLRWDADTATGKQSEAIILSHFKHHNADVLIGTQMLAKGLDLPLVTLVGVVLADVGLNFPDYRAGERAFQLLTQVSGRAGRSRLGGKAVLQTFQPDHYAIQHASEHDFNGFYTAELDRRRDIQYPPYTRVIRFEARDLYREKAEQRAEKLSLQIICLLEKSADKTLEMIGPAPPYFGRKNGYYRWQVILKGGHPEKLIEKLKLDNWRVEINPPDLL
jgi:primosomal protein N' (replication factor Y)